MDCRHLSDDLIADFDRIERGERDLIQEHLGRCVPCRGRFDEVRLIVAALPRLQEAPPAPLLAELDAAVLAARPAPASPAPKRVLVRTGTAWAFAFAFAAACALVAFLTWLDKTGVQRPTRPTVIDLTVRKEDSAPKKDEKPVVKEEPRKDEVKPPVIARGDLNGDGVVDTADHLLLARLVAGSGEADRKAADVNQDGTVDVSDVRALTEEILRTR